MPWAVLLDVSEPRQQRSAYQRPGQQHECEPARRVFLKSHRRREPNEKDELDAEADEEPSEESERDHAMGDTGRSRASLSTISARPRGSSKR